MSRSKSIKFPNSLSEFENLFDKLQRAGVNMALTSGGLTIKEAESPLAKTVTDVYAIVDGVLVKVAAGDMPELDLDTITADKFNVIVLTVNAAATVTPLLGTQAATLGGVVFPTIADPS